MYGGKRSSIPVHACIPAGCLPYRMRERVPRSAFLSLSFDYLSPFDGNSCFTTKARTSGRSFRSDTDMAIYVYEVSIKLPKHRSNALLNTSLQYSIHTSSTVANLSFKVALVYIPEYFEERHKSSHSFTSSVKWKSHVSPEERLSAHGLPTPISLRAL
ncbi:unnamed protein product [Arabidopsis lyrata]|nr:unnamed protein product [Arabidopsis lyrata]